MPFLTWAVDLFSTYSTLLSWDALIVCRTAVLPSCVKSADDGRKALRKCFVVFLCWQMMFNRLLQGLSVLLEDGVTVGGCMVYSKYSILFCMQESPMVGCLYKVCGNALVCLR